MYLFSLKLQLKCCSSKEDPLSTAAACSSCPSCWDVVCSPVDHMVKAVGAVSLLFSFTEASTVDSQFWFKGRTRIMQHSLFKPASLKTVVY